MHVPHDERGTHRHRHGGNHAGPGRLLRQPGLRQDAAAGPPGTGQRQRRRQCRQGRQPAAGAADPARGHQAHAACAKELLRGRAGAQPVLRAAGGRGPHGRAAGGAGCQAAAGGVDPHRQELAQRVLPGGQQPGDPDPRWLWLHARLPRGAVLARQPPEHDPRGHARHPGRRPAGPQGSDAGRRRPAAAGAHHWRHHCPGAQASGTRRLGGPAGPGPAGRGRSHAGRLGHRQPYRGVGQRRALHAGLRPHRAGLDVAGRGVQRTRTGCYSFNSC